MDGDTQLLPNHIFRAQGGMSLSTRRDYPVAYEYKRKSKDRKLCSWKKMRSSTPGHSTTFSNSTNAYYRLRMKSGVEEEAALHFLP